MSKIAVVYETEFKEVLASSSLSNSEKVKQLINFKPAPVWNSEKNKYENAGDCGPLREIVKIYKPKYLEKVRDIADRKEGIIEQEKHKIEVEKMTSLVCPDSKNGFIILGHDSYEYKENVYGYTKKFTEAIAMALEAVNTGEQRISEYEDEGNREGFYSSRIVDLDTRLQIGKEIIGYFFNEEIVENFKFCVEEIKKMEEEMLILEEEFLKLVFVEFAKKEYSVDDLETW
jgi:hypothetical protein